MKTNNLTYKHSPNGFNHSENLPCEVRANRLVLSYGAFFMEDIDMKAVDLLHGILWLECNEKASGYIQLLFERAKKGFSSQEKTDLTLFSFTESIPGLFKFVGMIESGDIGYDWFYASLIKIREGLK